MLALRGLWSPALQLWPMGASQVAVLASWVSVLQRPLRELLGDTKLGVGSAGWAASLSVEWLVRLPLI